MKIKNIFTLQGHTLERFQVKEIEFDYYPPNIPTLGRHRITTLGKYSSIEKAKKAYPDALELETMIEVILYQRTKKEAQQRKSWLDNLKFGEVI